MFYDQPDARTVKITLRRFYYVVCDLWLSVCWFAFEVIMTADSVWYYSGYGKRIWLREMKRKYNWNLLWCPGDERVAVFCVCSAMCSVNLFRSCTPLYDYDLLATSRRFEPTERILWHLAFMLSKFTCSYVFASSVTDWMIDWRANTKVDVSAGVRFRPRRK